MTEAETKVDEKEDKEEVKFMTNGRKRVLQIFFVVLGKQLKISICTASTAVLLHRTDLDLDFLSIIL